MTEAWLDSHHVTWQFVPELALEQIDKAKSRANQARVDEPVRADLVDQYAAAMKRGDVFPAVLAHKAGPKARKVTLLGGNHRHEAAEKVGKVSLPAYVVECEPATATVLAYSDNARHGFPPSTAERVRQAVHLIAMGWTAENAAAAVGVSAPTVSAAKKAAEGSRRAKELGVPGFDRIQSQTTQTELARIQSNAVFEAAVRLVDSANVSAADAIKLGKRLKAARSESDQLKIIGDEIEERRTAIQQRAGGKAPKAPRTAYGTVNAALVAVADVRPADLAAACPTPDARVRLRKRIQDSIITLGDLEKALR